MMKMLISLVDNKTSTNDATENGCVGMEPAKVMHLAADKRTDSSRPLEPPGGTGSGG